MFNTTALIGPQGVLSRYRKVNPWIPWEIHASPHDIAGYAADPFPVVETEIGRLGVAICYDWLFPESIRQIAFNGAEIIVRVSAYMDPWGATQPDGLVDVDESHARWRTLAYVVAANQGASLAQLPALQLARRQHGGDDYDGRILAQADAGPGEKVVVRADRSRDAARRARAPHRHDTRAHLRSEVHSTSRDLISRAQPGSITGESLRARIAAAKTDRDE